MSTTLDQLLEDAEVDFFGESESGCGCNGHGPPWKGFGREIGEVESEVNRSSRDYIRWVQASLNRVLGTSLKVDGISGPSTRDVIRKFQAKFLLAVDGKVGPQTEAVLISTSASVPPTTSSSSAAPSGAASGPYPPVNTLMPKQGPGFFCRMVDSRRWGLPETIQALQEVGRRWNSAHPGGPLIVISDISKRGGGKLCISSGFCHASHQVGLDVDIRVVRNDGKDTFPCSQGSGLCVPGAISYRSKSYSLEMTRELIDLIRSNGILPVKTIGFLDKRIPHLSRWSGHDKHMHVRFCMPAKYKSAINLRKTYSKTPPNYRC